MINSAFIVHQIAGALVGVIFAALSWAVIGWLWPGMGLPAFIAFLVSWSLEGANTRALERRHPELILLPGWKRVKVRYKPLDLGENEYEITLGEFIRAQIALIILGIPFSLFVAGLVGLPWPDGRWPVFLVVFGVWAAFMVMGIVWAINKE